MLVVVVSVFEGITVKLNTDVSPYELVTKINTLPSFLAVITPDFDTVAILVSLDSYVRPD